MTEIPFLTIAIPTRNRAIYLQKALESAVGQTYSNIEIIVSNNMSHDNTQRYLENISDRRVKIFHQESALSMIENWNFCLQKSSGRYFILLADDDTLELNAIESIAAAFKFANFSGNVAFFSFSFINEANLTIKKFNYKHKILSKKDILRKYLFGFFRVMMCSTAYNTDSLRGIDGYSTKFSLASDAFAWLSCVYKYGNATLFPENVANYRIHPQMTTRKSLTSLWIKEYIDLFKFCRHEINFLEKIPTFLGLCFVICKQLIKWVSSVFKIY